MPFALATHVLIVKQVVKQFTDVALGYGDNDGASVNRLHARPFVESPCDESRTRCDRYDEQEADHH